MLHRANAFALDYIISRPIGSSMIKEGRDYETETKINNLTVKLKNAVMQHVVVNKSE